MFSWFEIAYAFLDAVLIFFCFIRYQSSRKRPFLLFGLAFTCLTISEFMWVFTYVSLLSDAMFLFGYIRLGLYAAFTLLILHALQLFSPKKKDSSE